MKKILIIEDDLLIGKVLQLKMQSVIDTNKIDAQVLRAKNGEEGITLIAVEAPDIILLDLMLPKKSGFEILETIRAKTPPSVPHIMILSNLSGEADKNRALTLGAHTYFVKSATSIEKIGEYVRDQILARES